MWIFPVLSIAFSFQQPLQSVSSLQVNPVNVQANWQQDSNDSQESFVLNSWREFPEISQKLIFPHIFV